MESDTHTTSTHSAAVSEAFGRKALVYDEFGRDHPHLDRMRTKVYDHISAVCPPNAHLLEINAGTGTDARALIERGYSVHATDMSPGMLAKLSTKAHERLTWQQCSFTELDQLLDGPYAGPYDGIYSNFGGLNCIPDLRAVTRHLPALLKPGGTVTWVVMPRVFPWEMALLPKDWRVATRRWRRSGVASNVEGVSFTTWYFSAAETMRAFGPRFEQVRLEGLSIFLPGADNNRFATRHPQTYQHLAALDDRIAQRWPFNAWGDFFILTMRYTPNQTSSAALSR